MLPNLSCITRDFCVETIENNGDGEGAPRPFFGQSVGMVSLLPALLDATPSHRALFRGARGRGFQGLFLLPEISEYCIRSGQKNDIITQ